MSDSHQFTIQLTPSKIFWGGFAAGVIVTLAAGFILSFTRGGNLLAAFRASNGDIGAVAGANQPAAPAPSAAQPSQPTAGPLKPVSNDDHIRGDKSAPVTLVEYSDFQCPFCGKFYPTLQQALNDYKGKVRLVYRHFPLSSIHPYAEKAAEASECASEQGKFWEYHDKLFTTQSDWSSTGLDAAKLADFARQVGVPDAAKFASCLSSGKYVALIQADEQSGETAGVQGTPGTFVVGKSGTPQLIPGALPYDAVKQMIDAALKG